MKRGQAHRDALRRMVESLTVESISETLETVRSQSDASEAKVVMDENHFDVLGVADAQDKVVGYVHVDSIGQGIVANSLKTITQDDIISPDASLEGSVLRIAEKRRLFVLRPKGVNGIVTVADLHKPPVRAMVFGIILFLEAALNSWIRAKYPDEGWRSILTTKLERAENYFRGFRARGEDLDLVDCLSLEQKTQILLGTADAQAVAGFDSGEEAKDTLKRIGVLRNNVCHCREPAFDMDWPRVMELLRRADEIARELLGAAEDIH